MRFSTVAVLILSALALASLRAAGQPNPSDLPKPLELTAQEDHKKMMEQLKIKELRRGADGNNPKSPNASNTDESKANPYKTLPDPLVFDDGKPVKTADEWKKRRAEILEHFDREIYGRLPKNMPKVTWEVKETTKEKVGEIDVTTKRLIGTVDNSSYPHIKVEIQLTLTTPTDASGPVPVMMEHGFVFPRRPGFNPPPPPKNGPKPWTQQLIEKGWGYAIYSSSSVQADSGGGKGFGGNGPYQGLTTGIIGLCNKGQPRQPEDWGALRAWAWGASRALDYLETDKAVDAKQVGIEGLSRYGKAAIVTMAYDERFAIGLIGSSGQGGAKIIRRNYGEKVENLASSGEYHWMAGNYLKYAGPLTPEDMPVDAHELVALCAPRPVFISGGSEKVEGTWIDSRGSFLAASGAGPVYKLLGKKDLGTSEFPKETTALIDGDVAFRQHEGGHTVVPNWPTFLTWADRYIKAPAIKGPAKPPAANEPPKPEPSAAMPIARTDANSKAAHEQLLEKAKNGKIDVYFVGDSITRRWGATDYPDFLANWKENFHGWNAANFGWGGDTVQNVLWRLQSGELDGVSPKVIVVMAGTNNLSGLARSDAEAKVDEVTNGLKAVLAACQKKAPRTVVILMGITPRNDNPAAAAAIAKINDNLAKFADGKSVRYLNINDKLADKEGKFLEGMSPDRLHLSVKGYQVWAESLKPVLKDLLGPPAKEDLAPPPTGDPSAAARPLASPKK
jgi:lysophospholipase L1-like esterase